MVSATRRRTVIAVLLVTLSMGRSPVGAAQDADGNGEWITVNGTQLWVHRKGERKGPPVVVIHGGPLLEHGYLEPWLSPLADEFELVFYDQRLSGRSAATSAPEDIRVATFVEDIEALRDALGLGDIHVLGHSWGGHLALRYALTHADSVRSLLLLDAMAASAEIWRREQAAEDKAMSDEDRAAIRRLRKASGVADGDPAAIERLLIATFRTQFHDRKLADRLDIFVPDDYLARSSRFATLGPDLAEFDLHPRLAEVRVPTLLLYGSSEPGLEHGGRALHEGLPNSRLEPIEGAGHFPFIERPTRFLRIVRDFLREAASR